ncbi:peptidoglycan-binding protein [Streptomyces sp. NPDC048182]|uniref:peptidoglycan-binding domain-containing protein n=1 Tax=Streptomyces sp. NPDC048182 TaxID=3365507 RepID=UPI003721A270
MEEQRQPCPECGAAREADNTPACGCGRRTSDALREARTAEAAATEDFEPLRIRPYVELRDGGEAAAPDPDATMTLRAVEAGPGVPSAGDLRLFESAGGGATAATGPSGRPPRGRRRRNALLAATGALAVVIGAAGYASGLFSYETPSRDGALPDEVRAGVPDAATDPAAASPDAPGPGAGAPGRATASASPSPSASPSASASVSESPSPSATPSRPASPTSAPSTPSGPPAPTATAPDAPPSDSAGLLPEAPADGGSLGPGDQGPEVLELQQRLGQLYLYIGARDGTYNRQVEYAVRTYQWARGLRSEELGVYGPATRRMLESETREP